MKEETKKKSTGKKKVFRRLFFVSLAVSILTLGVLYFLNILPIIYFVILSVILFGYDFLMGLLMLSKGWKRRLFGTIFTVLKMLCLFFVIFYSASTMDFLHKITGGNYNTENYSILVLNQSDYEKIKDIQDKKVGIVKLGDDKGLLEAKLMLNKKVSVEYVEFEDLDSLANALLKKQVDAIMLEEAEKKMLEENDVLLSKERVIYEFSIDIEIEDGLVKNVNITKEPFSVFLSGIDSYGKITSVSRSDVNMLVTVNPKTHKVLLTSIPRDYYVPLHGISSKYKDKITHAGIHGIDTSVKTVEDLLDVDINYYAKVNFTSLVDIVNELGGVDVTLEKGFKAYYIDGKETVNYIFQKGKNHLNGKEALAFARERKSLPLGDVGRVEHQQMLLEAILNKVLSKNIIMKYSDLLNAMNGKFVTNFGTENITKLVKQQLKDMPSWQFDKYTLGGTDGHEYTYTYKKVKSYVMVPDLETVEMAKGKIKSVLEEA